MLELTSPLLWGCLMILLGAVAAASEKAPHPRCWPTPDPLYEELFSDEKRAIEGHSAFIWLHMFDPKLPTFALQYGVRYSFAEMAAGLQQHGIHLYTSDGSILEDRVIRHYDLKGVLYSPVHSAGASFNVTVPEGRWKGSPFLLDPANVDDLMKQTAEIIDRYGDGWWGIALGDEPVVYKKGAFFSLWEQQVDYPYLQQAAEEIREQYGFGKFGPPSRQDAEDEPFQFIAFNRWFFNGLAEVQKRFYETVKAKNPDLWVIGEDSGGSLSPYGYSRYGEYVDLATGQSVPGHVDGLDLSGEFRQLLGFKTKFIRDLTSKETWIVPHVEHYLGDFTPEEVSEFLSETVRAGGTGFQIWNYDYRSQKAQKNFTHNDYYGAPGRWQVIMDAIDRLRTMPLLKFPPPDSAILLSNHSCYSRDRADGFTQYEGAFTFLGPGARAWFRFVSDWQIADGKCDLKEYKALFLPFEKYQEPEVSEVVAQYAEGGGNVVCGDPEVFQYHLDGTATPQFRRRMFGVTLGEQRESPPEVTLVSHALWPQVAEGQKVPVDPVSSAFDFTPDPGVIVLGRYPDGKPAIALKEHGPGRSLYFGFNPFYVQYLSHPEWREVMLSLIRGLGIATGQDLWRFKFPLPELPDFSSDLRCLTGNHFYWQNNEVQAPYNEPVEGCSYRYSVPPDGEGQQEGAGPVAFADGNLTDRLQAPEAGNVDLGIGSLSDWVVSWETREPVEITFDLGRRRQVHQVRVVYTDEMPEMTLATSPNGQDFQPLVTAKGRGVTSDVLDLTLEFPPVGTQWVRLIFGPREVGELVLSEVEIWGR